MTGVCAGPSLSDLLPGIEVQPGPCPIHMASSPSSCPPQYAYAPPGQERESLGRCVGGLQLQGIDADAKEYRFGRPSLLGTSFSPGELLLLSLEGECWRGSCSGRWQCALERVGGKV